MVGRDARASRPAIEPPRTRPHRENPRRAVRERRQPAARRPEARGAAPHGGADMAPQLFGAEGRAQGLLRRGLRSEEHTSELQSLMRISYAVFCLKKKTQ